MRVDKKIWRPISTSELGSLTKDELKNLLSFCWMDGKYRCHTIGINDVSIEQKEYSYIQQNQQKTGIFYLVKWSDMDGDPKIQVRALSLPIDKLGDGEWDYGLYIKR